MMGSIMLPDTPLGFYAIEFSPLYIGSPAFFNDTTPPIGGGFVDPIGEAAMLFMVAKDVQNKHLILLPASVTACVLCILADCVHCYAVLNASST
jgi:hypothetical protein